MAFKRYRVKVVVENNLGLSAPDTKYVIQQKGLFWWDDECDPTTNKEWAYQTCEEMNTPYNEMREKMKKK